MTDTQFRVIQVEDYNGDIINLTLDPENAPDDVDVIHWYGDDESLAYCGKDISSEPYVDPAPESIVCDDCYLVWISV